MNSELNEYETKLVKCEDMFSTIRGYIRSQKCKPLTKKQLQALVTLMDHREARAKLQGYSDGVQKEKSRNEFRTRQAQTRNTTIEQVNKLVESASNIIQGAFRILDEAR